MLAPTAEPFALGNQASRSKIEQLDSFVISIFGVQALNMFCTAPAGEVDAVALLCADK